MERSGTLGQIGYLLMAVLVIASAAMALCVLLPSQSAEAGGGCYAQWHLNEFAGKNVTDSSGNGRNGMTVNMGDPNWQGALLNNGLKFDAVDNQYVDCGSIAAFDFDDEFSFEIWVMAGPAGRPRYLFGKGTPDTGIAIFMWPGGGIEAALHDTSSTRCIREGTGGLVADNSWHHIVVTYDGSGTAGGLTIYVDGSDASIGGVSDIESGDSMITPERLTIGATGDGAIETFRDGVLDEAVIYGYELSSSQVAERCNWPAGTESPPPTVTSTSPDFAAQSAPTVEIIITGKDFTDATVVGFGSGIAVNSYTVDSDTQITANITVEATAILGPREVSVTAGGVTGTLPDGFEVTSPPTVNSTSPSSAAQGATSIDIIIEGSDFTGASAVGFGADIDVNYYTVDSSSQITANIDVADGAPIGSTDVSVTAGGVMGMLTAGFSINCPPTVTSIIPISADRGDTIDIDIRGTNFIEVSNISFGPGTFVGSATIFTPTDIRATVSIDNDAALGERGVSVTAGGVTDTLINGFTVTDPPDPPTLASISPSFAAQGATIDVIITGTNLTGGIFLSFGSGITINSYNSDDSTQITASISIDGAAETGPRDVWVMAEGGEKWLPDGFTVTSPPTVTSTSPTFAAQGATAADVTITGTDFTGVSDVSLGSGITVNSYNFDSDTQITANITVDGTAFPGPRDVSVTAGGVPGMLTDGFAVTSPPTVTAVSLSDDAKPGDTIEVIITGTNFTGATDVNMGDGITVASFTVDSATQITATISLDPNANAGPRDVSVTAGGHTATLSDGFGVESPDGSSGPPYRQPWLYLLAAALTMVLGGVYIYRRRTGTAEADLDTPTPMPAGTPTPPPPTNDVFLPSAGAQEAPAPEPDSETEDHLEELNGEETDAEDMIEKGLRNLLLGKD
jgi:hypothetical protein